ncbi:CinA family protein [Lentzea sp. NPDC003310]|uniref:CinA family protein n=1 Tax=Lentzea sp. NPDC003310 TaxID=3154447 RepID=UPI0033A142D3
MTTVVDLLKAKNQTVATAESLTAGLLCATIVDTPGASAVVRGGLIVYATELKHKLAGVDQRLLDEHGAVHPDVAIQLAEGARRTCESDWGIGLTGVAGPDPQDGIAPGTVHIGLSGPGVSTVRTITVRGDRTAVRSAAVEKALVLLSDHLLVTDDGNK